MQRTRDLPLAQMARLGGPVGPPLELRPPPLSQSAGSMALLVLAAAAWGGAAWMAAQGSGEMAVGAAVLGLGSAASAALLLWRREGRRATLGLFADGLTCSRRGRTRVFPYDEIRSLALRETEELANGVPVGLRRRLRLRSAAARFAVLHLARHGEPDAFGSWLDPALEGMADAAERGLAGGRPLAGPGWVLTATGLRTGPRETPFAELGAVDRMQRRVAVWRGGDELPFFAVDAGSANALVLARVLGRRIGERPASEGETAGLGRLLFAQRNSRLAIATAVLIGLMLVVPSALLLPAGGRQTALGSAMIVLGVGAFVAAAVAARYRVRCHENGLVRRTVFGSRALPYSAVERLGYRAVAVYFQGTYGGTNVRMVLRPPPPARKLVVKAMVQGPPEDFDKLRDRVATLIAGRLAERLGGEGEVEWVPSVWLSRDGLRFVEKRLRGGGEELAVDYRQEIGFDVERDVFRLFLPPKKKPVLKIPCWRENFYPGFLLFQQLVWETIEPASSSG